MNKWIDTGNISVKDAFRFKPTDSEQEGVLLAETYKREKVKGIHLYLRSKKGVKTYLGKRVIEFTSINYNYKKNI